MILVSYITNSENKMIPNVKTAFFNALETCTNNNTILTTMRPNKTDYNTNDTYNNTNNTYNNTNNTYNKIGRAHV